MNKIKLMTLGIRKGDTDTSLKCHHFIVSISLSTCHSDNYITHRKNRTEYPWFCESTEISVYICKVLPCYARQLLMIKREEALALFFTDQNSFWGDIDLELLSRTSVRNCASQVERLGPLLFSKNVIKRFSSCRCLKTWCQGWIFNQNSQEMSLLCLARDILSFLYGDICQEHLKGR